MTSREGGHAVPAKAERPGAVTLRLLKLLGRVENQAGFALGFGAIVRRHLAAKGFAGSAALFGRLNALDAAPAFAAFGFDLAHFLFGMMRTTVIAEKCVSHSDKNKTGMVERAGHAILASFAGHGDKTGDSGIEGAWMITQVAPRFLVGVHQAFIHALRHGHIEIPVTRNKTDDTQGC